jgi:acetyl esterase/lipase
MTETGDGIMITGMRNPLTTVLRIIGFFLFLAWPYSQMKAYAAEPAILERDITYGTADGIDLKLDLCRPSAGTGPFPVLVYIHGGFWGLSGSIRKDQYAETLSEAASRGYVAVAIESRQLTFDWDSRTMKYGFPEQIYDDKCAIRWLRANAKKYNMDPERIGALGESSGGHLALMLALTDKSDGLEGDCGDMTYSSRIQAAVSLAGPTELASLRAGKPAPVDAFLGGPPTKLPDVFAKASPLTYVTKDDPAVLLVHGDMDKTVPLQQSELLDAKLNAVGVPHALIIKKGYGHSIWYEDEVWKFLDDNLHP